MGTFLVAFFAMLLIISAMAIGVIFGRKPLTGSCGGVGDALGEKDYTCELCGGDEKKCEEIKSGETPQNGHLAVNAADKKQ
ncbi:(Na+)-NQR maturation NqrM [Gilvimarinus agarilyticus]|uniref:(Na+)-NQR maturation NqrM n=1 Tax=unclassified Gilvimarinus TaxID=2642066 RepID=UPI001C0941A8|nr:MULTISPECIES: (Na+)-NQR maturation NqrM [unclassified Gilvimarinus]MBU2885145.1 (Na+)-NQR maturation NqrM [Gilvimarinus agarilyticus]MDO6570043.1 (Na+)-NQR maturation NqrM [Gilvimarinus sp. 2_MG-2023]MDO6747310.1 (Na+)-NQR maturation NqrM [Gilvimarinus sp. 1_MG-2023]